MEYLLTAKITFAKIRFPDWPMVVWMILATMLTGFLGGLDATGLVKTFNAGWGAALGEFALILLPSFMLAAAMSQNQTGAARQLVIGSAPFAAAGMVCPDTAYAALSPVAGRQKLNLAFGSYAGFKLLFPAGPLIVATGLGYGGNDVILYAVVLFIPVWLAGAIWSGLFAVASPEEPACTPRTTAFSSLIMFASFILLGGLLICGVAFDLSGNVLIDFVTKPKGALIAAAILAMSQIPTAQRRDAIDRAVRRTGALLLVIGAASAFGRVLTAVVPLGEIIPTGVGLTGIIGLFLLTALFKLAQGSSMATFAAIAPVAAPIIVVAGLSPLASVLAICLGSFVAILPNDSFYWLVRRDALAEMSEPRAIGILAGGAMLQAVTGMAVLLLLAWAGMV